MYTEERKRKKAALEKIIKQSIYIDTTSEQDINFVSMIIEYIS